MKDTISYLVKRAKQGDQIAFNKLVELHQHKVYRICFQLIKCHYEAQDLAQETFLRAYKNINNHDVNKKFSNWLFRIATNLTVDRHRKKKPDFYLDSEMTGTEGITMYTRTPNNSQLPENRILEMEFQNTIQKAIFRLPPKYRSVIILKYMEDLSLKEISEVMQITVEATKTRLHRGREILCRYLKSVPKCDGHTIPE